MKKTNIETLKKQFDKVYLRHIRPTPQTGTTIGVLVEGKTAYVGVSKCHEGDQFSREIGRNISFGRALSLKGRNSNTNSATSFTVPYNNESGEDLLNKIVTSLEEKSLAF